jgi:hypothetical protein
MSVPSGMRAWSEATPTPAGLIDIVAPPGLVMQCFEAMQRIAAARPRPPGRFGFRCGCGTRDVSAPTMQGGVSAAMEHLQLAHEKPFDDLEMLAEDPA